MADLFTLMAAGSALRDAVLAAAAAGADPATIARESLVLTEEQVRFQIEEYGCG